MAKKKPLTISEEDQIGRLEEITVAEPWLLPKKIVFPNGATALSREVLVNLGFQIRTQNDLPIFGKLFYVVTERPEGWTKVYQPLTQLIAIHDENGIPRFLISYDFAEQYARLIMVKDPNAAMEKPKVDVGGLLGLNPLKLMQQIQEIMERYVVDSNPWLIAKELVLPNSGVADSREELAELGFMLEELEGHDAYDHLFYQAVSRPEGWSKSYDALNRLVLVTDETQAIRLIQCYSFSAGFAQIILSASPKEKGEGSDG